MDKSFILASELNFAGSLPSKRIVAATAFTTEFEIGSEWVHSAMNTRNNNLLAPKVEP